MMPSVLYQWKKQWTDDPNWRPWNTQHLGLHNRTFTEDEEADLAKEIIEQWVMPARLFNSATFRDLAMRRYQESGRDPHKFQCSDHFIHNFRRRHGFSSRRFHLRRRRRSMQRADIEEWRISMCELLSRVDHHRVISCDETAWRVVPTGLLTWAPVGADNVKVYIEAFDKDAITMLASITAASEKLPLFMIAKGRTSRVEVSQLGITDGHQTSHSPSGWTMTETFHQYLQWLRAQYDDTERMDLILDCFSVHRSRETHECAKRLKIQLHYIPPGWTDELQPLDRYVFGALKAICRRLFCRHCQESDANVRRPDAARFAQEAWDALETHIVEKGWGIFEDALGSPDSDDYDDDGTWDPSGFPGFDDDEEADEELPQ
jgi:hypothetical protein